MAAFLVYMENTPTDQMEISPDWDITIYRNGKEFLFFGIIFIYHPELYGWILFVFFFFLNKLYFFISVLFRPVLCDVC